MGTRSKTYGDSCRSARFVARHGEALKAVRDEFNSHPHGIAWVEEMFLAALHEMTASALRDIADAIDPALPET
jgi:hypothetical protein